MRKLVHSHQRHHYRNKSRSPSLSEHSRSGSQRSIGSSKSSIRSRSHSRSISFSKSRSRSMTRSRSRTKLGKDNKRQMGPYYRKSRLQDSIRQKASTFPNSSLLSTVKQSRVERRGPKSPSEKGSGENNTGLARFLFKNISCFEEKRKVPSHHRSVQTEFIPENSDFQDGNSKQGQTGYIAQRLGLFIGPYRCISTCSNSQYISEIPEVLFERPGISIPGPSIRASNQPVCFYSNDDSHRSSSAKTIHCAVSLPGRLACQEPISSTGQTVLSQIDIIPRSTDQSREVGINSISDFCVYRDGISNSRQHCQSSSGQNARNSVFPPLVSNATICNSKGFPVSFRATECNCSICSIGQITFKSTSNGPICSVEASQVTTDAPGSYNRSNQTSFEMVEQELFFTRSCSQSNSSISHDILGCQNPRLGCSSGARGSTITWSLGSKPISTPYKHIRDESHISSSQRSPRNIDKLHSSDCHRQLIGSVLHQETRGHTFSNSLHGGVEHASVVRQKGNNSASMTYSRNIQCPSQPVIKNIKTNLNRVVTGSDNMQQDICSDRLPKHRSFCDTTQLQTAIVCVSDTRQQGISDRCSVDELGRNIRLRISPISYYSSSSKEDLSTSVQNSTDSTIVASKILVSRASTAISSSHKSSHNSKSVDSSKGKDCTSKPNDACITCLGIIKQSVRNKSFSEQVAEHVSRSRRDSTRRVYDAK